MNLYLAIANDRTYITAAASCWEAEARVIASVFPGHITDDLSDIITLERIEADDIKHFKGGDITIL